MLEELEAVKVAALDVSHVGCFRNRTSFGWQPWTLLDSDALGTRCYFNQMLYELDVLDLGTNNGCICNSA